MRKNSVILLFVTILLTGCSVEGIPKISDVESTEKVSVIKPNKTISPQELSKDSIKHIFERPYSDLESVVSSAVNLKDDKDFGVISVFEDGNNVTGYILDKDGKYYSANHSLVSNETHYLVLEDYLSIGQHVEGVLHQNDITHFIEVYINKNGIVRVLLVINENTIISEDLIAQAIHGVKGVVTELEVTTLSESGFRAFEKDYITRGHFNEYIIDGYLRLDTKKYSSHFSDEL